MAHIAPRTVVLWSGPIAAIPTGWNLCDGTHGTPDLRDRFVIGAGSTYAPDDTGGTTEHLHTGTTDGHTHTIPAGTPLSPGVVFGDVVASAQDTFTTDLEDNIPPFYALAYIMLLA